MHYNQRTDYRVSREIAGTWWSAMPSGKFSIVDAKAWNERDRTPGPDGPWAVVNTQRTDEFAGIVAQPLQDGSEEWGIAVLWYDGEKCSPLSRWFRGTKLSGSKEAAKQIGEAILRLGGETFPVPADAVKSK